MITAVTKEITFDCAHMLSGHRGKCANLHGHTYKVQVTIVGVPKHDKSSDYGMVLDFGDLKEVLQDHIVSVYDHAIIFSAEPFRNEAEEELLNWARRNKMRYHIMNGRTTSETMAHEMQLDIQIALRHVNIPFDHVSVRVWETPTSFAEV